MTNRVLDWQLELAPKYKMNQILEWDIISGD